MKTNLTITTNEKPILRLLIYYFFAKLQKCYKILAIYSYKCMLPFFKIGVNEDDETGIDFNSFVDYPAHMKNFIAFGKKQNYSVNKESRIVTGVMISANTPIYRSHPEPHYVVFTPEVIQLIKRKFFKNGFIQNLNDMHDQRRIIDGATFIESYTVSNSNPNLPNVPEAFADLKLQDGTWIGSYYIDNDDLWKDVLAGKWGGFSVEGWFDRIPMDVKKAFKKVNNNKSNMNKPKKTIWQHLFGADDPAKEKFATATAADGMTLMYDGELAVGTQVFVEADGEQIPAPEGDYEVTLEDGSVKLITLDGSGVVTSAEDFVADPDGGGDELRAEVADAMKKVLKDVNDRFTKVEKDLKSAQDENAALKSELETLKKGGKFGANPKPGAGGDGKKTYRDVLNPKK